MENCKIFVGAYMRAYNAGEDWVLASLRRALDDDVPGMSKFAAAIAEMVNSDTINRQGAAELLALAIDLAGQK